MQSNLNLRAIAFALAALASSHPLSASAKDGAKSEQVFYGDLDLSSDSGVKALDRRLDRAVKRVCGTATLTDIGSQRRIADCHEDTWRSVRSQREIAIAGHRNGTSLARGATGQTMVAAAE